MPSDPDYAPGMEWAIVIGLYMGVPIALYLLGVLTGWEIWHVGN